MVRIVNSGNSDKKVWIFLVKTRKRRNFKIYQNITISTHTGDEEDNCDEEDMSIPFGGTAAGRHEYRGRTSMSSRFSEMSIEERKDR